MKIDVQNWIMQFNALDRNIRYAGFAVLILFFIALDYGLIMQFQFWALRNMDVQDDNLVTGTAQVKRDIKRIDQIKQGLDDSRLRFQGLIGKVRSVQEVPAVLEDISRSANEWGVTIEQLSPSKDGPELLISGDQGKYYSLAVVIGAHSGYHKFAHFLNKLENNLLFLMSDLTVSSGGKLKDVSMQATIKVILIDKSPEVKK